VGIVGFQKAIQKRQMERVGNNQVVTRKMADALERRVEDVC
jgi:hypothetical protein